MFFLQNTKTQILATPQSVATNATLTSGQLDCIGYDECLLHLLMSGAASTATVPGRVQIQHSDTTDATNFAAISGYTATASTSGFPTQVANSSTTSVFEKAHIDLRDKKRYLRVLVDGQAGTTSFISIVAVLGRPSQSPTGTNTGALYVVNPS